LDLKQKKNAGRAQADYGQSRTLPELKNQKGGEPNLPAVAAIATVAAITSASTAATATTTAIAATAAAVAATTTATTTTATRTFGLGTSFVDYQVPATEILTVQAGHCAVSIFIVGNFDEGKTTRLAGETITNQTDCRGTYSHL
jgi:hypothetical protein